MSDSPLQEFGHRKSRYLRPNQPWVCGNTGNECSQGPDNRGNCPCVDSPCTPVRSVKSRKRVATLWLVSLFVGILVLFFSTSNLLEMLSPGPLSISHAEVAGCQDCHNAAGEPISGWLHKALTLNSNNDDQQCLECHALGSNAFEAHSTNEGNFSSINFDKITQQQQWGSADWKIELAGKLNTLRKPSKESTSCSSCHREHKGKFHPINNFDAQRCHTCHQKKFDAIEESHPEYSNYPSDKPTQIHFDHSAHLENYFYEDEYFDLAPEGCKQCHETDQTGEWMLSNSFEDTCSGCHLDQILGGNRGSAKGLAVLTIPELDIAGIEKAGFSIGDWPKWADGEMAPIMKMLLHGHVDNPAHVNPLAVDTITLYDLTDASQQDIENVARLAWDIKELFYDIQRGGTGALLERLDDAFGKRLDQPTLNRLIASLPRDTLINNQKQWFPHLAEEVMNFRRNKREIPPSTVDKNTAPGNYVESDNIVAADTSTNDIDTGLIDIDDESGDILDDDSLDGGNLDDDILGGDDADDDILNDDLSDDDLSDEEDNGNKAVASDDVDLNAQNSEDWASSGGWYRDGSSIRYRPIDHADPFFTTWLAVSSYADNQLHQEIFESLTDKQSVGGCTKCHSLADMSDHSAGKQVHWQSFEPEDITTDFNRFSHVSHFSLMTDDGCASCHILNEGAESELADTLNQTPKIEQSFLSMTRQTCTQCHQQGRAPANCLTCHQYHAERQGQTIDQISDKFTTESP
ncbi:hypothetical protein A9Q99_17500 [Gammaproteobacteria bacterium 45_16_T64]|nr:hypothetical protein A9Q99_17500 [Gammaproteobacteria bacterium 45_16_T64]